MKSSVNNNKQNNCDHSKQHPQKQNKKLLKTISSLKTLPKFSNAMVKAYHQNINHGNFKLIRSPHRKSRRFSKTNITVVKRSLYQKLPVVYLFYFISSFYIITNKIIFCLMRTKQDLSFMFVCFLSREVFVNEYV